MTPNSRFYLFKMTFLIRMYSFAYIPLLWWVRPSMIEISAQKVVLKIPLFRRTQNHLKVMYFGALAMGAEACIAAAAIKAIYDSGQKVDFIFKDFKADFLKRAEGDVCFTCEQIPEVVALVQKALQNNERVSQTFSSYATTPSKSGAEPIAKFEVTLSLKKRQKKN